MSVCPTSNTCGNCVRGVLCRACNVGLGSLGDTPERLLAATNYLFRNHGIPEIPNVALKKERTNGRK